MQKSSNVYNKRAERKFMFPQNTTIHYIEAAIKDQILCVLSASGVVLTGIPHKKTMSVTTIPRPTSKNKRLRFSKGALRNMAILHINKRNCLVYGKNYANESIQTMKRKKLSLKNCADVTDCCCCVFINVFVLLFLLPGCSDRYASQT